MKDAEDLLDLRLALVAIAIAIPLFATIQSSLCVINADNCYIIDGRLYNWVVEIIRSVANWYNGDKIIWLLSVQDWFVALLPKPQVVSDWFWRVIVPGLPS